MKAKVLPKTARIGRWGFCNTLRGKHFSRFEFSCSHLCLRQGAGKQSPRPPQRHAPQTQTVDRILAIRRQILDSSLMWLEKGTLV